MTKSKLAKNLLIHPILIAIYPILFLYSKNTGEVEFKEILTPILFSLIFAGILFSIFYFFVTKKNTKKSGVIVTYILLFFFFYGHLYLPLRKQVSHIFLFSLWSIILITGLVFLIRSKKDFIKSTKILNIVSVFLVLFSFINLIIFGTSNRSVNVNRNNANNAMANSNSTQNNPDIYYIIPDGYTSIYNLEKYFQFKNKDFVNYLKTKGFYVAERSAPNYALTYTSLASSMNLKHVNHYKKIMGAKSKNIHHWYNLVRHNSVVCFLKKRGYRFLHFGCGKGETMHNEWADVDYKFGAMSEFMMTFLQTTMLKPFENKFIDQIGRSIKQVNKVSEIVTMNDKPKFVFVHLLLPHPPLSVDRNGNSLPVEDMRLHGSDWLPRNRYVEQVMYTNKLLKKMLNAILSKSAKPPVIILQGDHGPYIKKQKLELYLRERFGILNAYYMPNGGYGKLHQGISPINTFRIIFNKYFGTKYKMLKEMFWYSEYRSPYDFRDITELVNSYRIPQASNN